MSIIFNRRDNRRRVFGKGIRSSSVHDAVSCCLKSSGCGRCRIDGLGRPKIESQRKPVDNKSTV